MIRTELQQLMTAIEGKTLNPNPYSRGPLRLFDDESLAGQAVVERNRSAWALAFRVSGLGLRDLGFWVKGQRVPRGLKSVYKGIAGSTRLSKSSESQLWEFGFKRVPGWQTGDALIKDE